MGAIPFTASQFICTLLFLCSAAAGPVTHPATRKEARWLCSRVQRVQWSNTRMNTFRRFCSAVNLSAADVKYVKDMFGDQYVTHQTMWGTAIKLVSIATIVNQALTALQFNGAVDQIKQDVAGQVKQVKDVAEQIVAEQVKLVEKVDTMEKDLKLIREDMEKLQRKK